MKLVIAISYLYTTEKFDSFKSGGIGSFRNIDSIDVKDKHMWYYCCVLYFMDACNWLSGIVGCLSFLL